MNKKLLILTVFLVLALFVMSSCENYPVGAKIKKVESGGGEVQNIRDDTRCLKSKTCLSTKPLYCNTNYQLSSNCGICGCPIGKTCSGTGKCVSQQTSSGLTKEITLGENMAGTSQDKIPKELDYSNFPKLFNTKINFQGKSYDVNEVVELGLWNRDNVSTQTSLAGPSPYDDYKDKVVLTATSDSVKYYYKFLEPIDLSKVTSSSPLEIKFLGKILKITSIDSAFKFTAIVGAEYYLKVGGIINVEGREIKLIDVGSGEGIIVSVSGGVQGEVTQDFVALGSVKTINGIEVYNKKSSYSINPSERSAVIIAGKEAVEIFGDGGAFIGEDPDDPKWIWDIGNLNIKDKPTIIENYVYPYPSGMAGINGMSGGPFIGVELDHNYRGGSDEPEVKIGECIKLPYDYLRVCLDSLTVPDTKYMPLTFELPEPVDLTSDSGIPGYSTANVINIKAGQDDGIILIKSALNNLAMDTPTKEIWLTGRLNNDVFYYDRNRRKKTFAGKIDSDVAFAKLNNGNLQLSLKRGEDALGLNLVAYSNTIGPYYLEGILTSYWGNDLNTGIKSLGKTKSSEEASELVYYNSYNLNDYLNKNIGTKDENHRTKYGIIVKDPKSYGASDMVELSIPNQQVKAVVTVK